MQDQEMPPESAPAAAPIIFKSFSIKTTQKVTILPVHQCGSDEEEEEEEGEPSIKRAKVSHFEDGVMITDEVKPKKKEPLVINRVISKDWRLKQLQEKEENGTITDEEKARLALMLEAGGNENAANGNKAIVVDADVDNADDPDYSQVKIEEFGMAILRGYGFKEDEGIGKTNKQVIKVNRQERRVKNLGLGATVVAEEDLKNLKVGSKVLVTAGKYCDKYGIVESLDPDTMSSYVKLALNREMVKVSQLNVKLVSSKEYEKKSKVLNQKTYDNAIQSRVEEEEGCSTSRKDRKDYWLHKGIVVKIITRKLGSNYYKSKGEIVELVDKYTAKVDIDGDILILDQKHLETVIPAVGKDMLIVNGFDRGTKASLLKIKERDYSLVLKLEEGSRYGREVKVSYEDASKLA